MRITITPEQAGQRLDKILASTGFALRAARRLCANHKVQVSGIPKPEAWKVRVGDVVEIVSEERDIPSTIEDAMLVDLPADYLAALFKPAGLHTVSLAGGAGASLEEALPRLLPKRYPEGFPRLLNRLDFATSGLVLAALHPIGQKNWDHGPVEKRYLALLEGEMREERVLTNKLDPSNPRTVRVLEEDDPDPARHTRINPLGSFGYLMPPSSSASLPFPGINNIDNQGWTGPVTLAGCSIVRGARHQIRVHAASTGFPLVGDKRYGARVQLKNTEPYSEQFFLHHGAVRLPGFEVSLPPVWLEQLPPDLAEAGQGWLHWSEQ